MKAIFHCSALALCLSIGAQAEDSPWSHWVLADMAQVRKEPQSGSSAIGSLSTGTQLKVKAAKDDWLLIDSAHQTPHGNWTAIKGWIHKSLVADTLVDEASLLRGIAQAKTLSDSLKWTERLVALLPRQNKYLKALQSAYVTAGNKAKAEALGRQLRGTDETYLARYEGDELLVIGMIDSTGEFTQLLWKKYGFGDDIENASTDSNSIARKTALNLKLSLTTRVWHALGEYSETTRRFQTIGISKGLDSDVEGTETYGLSLGGAVDVFKRTYGRSLFATKPLYDVPSIGVDRKAVWDSLVGYRKKLVGSAFDSTGVNGVEYRNLHEYGFLDITVSGGVRYEWYGTGVWSQRGLFDASRKLVWPPEYKGGNLGFAEYDDELVPRTPPHWFRFGNTPASPAYIILPFSTDPPANFRGNVDDYSRFGEYGFHLIRLKKGEFKFYTVRSSNAGC
jgi:hypothetical protein